MTAAVSPYEMVEEGLVANIAEFNRLRKLWGFTTARSVQLMMVDDAFLCEAVKVDESYGWEMLVLVLHFFDGLTMRKANQLVQLHKEQIVPAPALLPRAA